MKKYFIALILIGIGTISCMPKKEKKIIAIDVLLIPSEKINEMAFQLNSKIYDNNPGTIHLDKNHIPHITLLQAYVFEDDLPSINNTLKGVFNKIKNDTLRAESLFYNPEMEESFAMISIGKSDPLLKLHKNIIDLLNPYFVNSELDEAFVPNPDGSPITESTRAYVGNFVNKHSYENFDPHISLGVAETGLLDSLAQKNFKPASFKATSLSMYQLGDHGTAQKLLWDSE